VTKPAIHDGRTFATVLVGQGSELENGESSKGTLGTSGEQPMSILARTEKKVTDMAGGDCMEIAGAQFMLNGSVERQLSWQILNKCWSLFEKKLPDGWVYSNWAY